MYKVQNTKLLQLFFCVDQEFQFHSRKRLKDNFILFCTSEPRKSI